MIRRRPYAYLRRSNAGTGATNGAMSFDIQKAAVLEMAARRGDPEPELVVEWGLSGAARSSSFGGTGRGGKRKAWHTLREAIDAGEVSALYSYSLSRLARSTRELLDLAEACVAAGVPIRTSKEGDIDGTTDVGRMYLTIMAAVATFEAENAASRARDRNAAMRDAGKYIGRAPYGSTIVDGQLVEHPDQAPILARVLALYGELRSPAKVARALNVEGLTAPEGGQWRDGTVRRILARQKEAPKTMTRVRGARAVPTARFARLLVCACGAIMTPARKHYRTAAGEARTWTGYTCIDARQGAGHTGRQAVPESEILAAAKEEAAHLRTPDQLLTESNADALRDTLAARRARVIDALEAGTISRSEAEPRLARIADELDTIDAQTTVVDIPPLDWERPSEAVNAVLRALWTRIELDPAGVPSRFEWAVPEWRAD